MAKNFKRHAQGRQGKYNRIPIRDLLSGEETRDKRITDALQLQNKQSQEYRKEYVRDIEGDAVKEMQHNRELQAFKDKVWKTTMENHKVAGEGEVRRLEQLADFAKDKSEFWKDFSTTYAGQYAKAALDVSGVIQDRVAEHQYNEFMLSPESAKIAEAKDTLEGITSDELLQEMVESHKSKNFKEIAHFADLDIRMTGRAKLLVVNDLLSEKSWNAQVEQLKELATAKGLLWNKDTVDEFFYMRRNELLKQLGLTPNSRAGRKLVKGINEKLIDTRADLIDIHSEETIAKRKEIFQSDSKKYIDSEDPDQYEDFTRNNLKRIVYTANNPLYINGREVPQAGTKADLHASAAHIAKTDLYAGMYSSVEQYLKHTADQPTPTAVKIEYTENGVVKTKWSETYGSRHPTFREERQKEWFQWIKEKNTAANTAHNEQDKAHKLELQARMSDKNHPKGWIDVTNHEQLVKVAENYTEFKETSTFLTQAQIFDPTKSKDFTVITNNLLEKFNTQDWKAYQEMIQFMPAEMQRDFQKLTNAMKLLNENGYSKKDIDDLSKGKIQGQVLGATKQQWVEPSTTEIQKIYSQDFLNEFVKRSDETDFAKRVRESFEAVDARVDKEISTTDGKTIKGVGVYRREEDGPSTRWLAFTPDNNSVLPEDQLKEKLAGKDGGLPTSNLNNLLNSLDPKKEGKFEHNGQYYDLLDNDVLDDVVVNIVNHRPVKPNETIDYLYENQSFVQGYEGKILSKTQIYNRILEAKGIKARIPQGSLDAVNYRANVHQLRINNWKNISDINKERLGILMDLYSEETLFPVAKDLDPNSPEYFETVDNRLRNYGYGNNGTYIVNGIVYDTDTGQPVYDASKGIPKQKVNKK
jgi:hypothetical protein